MWYSISMGEKRSCSVCESWYLTSEVSEDAEVKYPKACRQCILDFIDWWNERHAKSWDDGISPSVGFRSEQVRAEFLLDRLLA